MGQKCCGSDRKGEVPVKIPEAVVRIMDKSQCTITFREPAKPMSVGGGTASFYIMKVKGKPRDKSDDSSEWWLGKELERAYDEVEFYYKSDGLRCDSGWEVFDFLMAFGGICKAFPIPSGNKDLLILQDISGPLHSARFVDVKIGSKTSDANWKGKSTLQSWKQDLIDCHTTSSLENLRVEGFLNPPSWLDTEDPLEELNGWLGDSKNVRRKAKRFKLQRLSALDAIQAFVDFHCHHDREQIENERAPTKEEKEEDEANIQCGEFAELILLSTIRRLSQLDRACQDILVPQKWVGSSVALVADAGVIIEREAWAEAMREEEEEGRLSQGPHNASVYIFDWGRSELCTESEWEELTEAEQQDRTKFWSSYTRGVHNLFSTACYLYWSHFCITEWDTLRIAIYDYDAFNDDDLLGRVEIKLPKEPPTSATFEEHELLDLRNQPILGVDRKRSLVKVRYWFVEYPNPSRFRGAWRVQVRNARHLTVADIHGSFFHERFDADPYATVTMVESEESSETVGLSAGKRRSYVARTEVVANSLDPLWESTFEFPVVKPNASESDAGLEAMHKVLMSPYAPGAMPSSPENSESLEAKKRQRESRVSTMFKEDCQSLKVSLEDFRETLEKVQEEWVEVKPLA